jgi:hypothetical protein
VFLDSTVGKAFFAMMAKKYGGYPNVIFEIYNEPNGTGTTWPKIKPYAEAVIEDAEKAPPVRAKKSVTTMLSKQVIKPARALQVTPKNYNNDAEIATALVDGEKVGQIARKLQAETGITYSSAYGRVSRIQKKIQTGEFK